MQKLRSLRKEITNWNKEEFGKLETRKGKALNELMFLEQNTWQTTECSLGKFK